MMMLILTLLFITVPAHASFDASAAQRRAAFTGVGAPVANITVPFLHNVTALQPNTTFVIPNSTTAVESAGPYDYALALTLPWQYLKAERLGRLPADNGIPWRANAFLDDPVVNSYADAVSSVLKFSAIEAIC